MNVNRSSQLSAIVIRISSFGESHSMVDLLTPRNGLLPCVAYGLRGRRSSLKGKIVPFARGTAWLYTDPRRDRSKITDFDVDRYALGLTADLDAYYEASLWAEVLWKSHASGSDDESVFNLMDGGLALLDRYPRRAADLGTVFLWRYLGHLGLQPDLDYSFQDERHFAPDEPRYYGGDDGTVVSGDWATPDMNILDGEAARFLSHTGTRSLTPAAITDVSDSSRRAARRFVVIAVQNAISTPLNTLKVSGALRGMGH